MILKYQGISDYGHVIPNSPLLYYISYLSQSSTHVPLNIIPFFFDVIYSNEIGQAEIKIHV